MHVWVGTHRAYVSMQGYVRTCVCVCPLNKQVAGLVTTLKSNTDKSKIIPKPSTNLDKQPHYSCKWALAMAGLTFRELGFWFS